jgi:hypothetical protein
MSTNRPQNLLKDIPSTSSSWLDAGVLDTLVTQNPQVASLANQINVELEKQNPVINPNRGDSFAWQKLSPNVKDAIAIGTALDLEFSAQYKQREKTLINQLISSNLMPAFRQEMNNLNYQGVATHIENENEQGNYHRWYHPIESAAVASQLTDNTYLQDMIKVVFQFHDTIQDYPKTATLNEIESANILVHKMQNAIDNFIENNPNMPAGLHQALVEYREMVPYLAWKNIVAATTMIKECDGQPTMFMVQKLIVEDVLVNSHLAEKTKLIEKTSLDQVALRISLVDSNLPALNLKEILGENIPLAQDFLTNPNFNINQQMNTLMQISNKGGEEKANANQAALLFGNNMRMAPELAEAYNGALKQAKFIYQNKEIDGVAVWNMATEASRSGDQATLDTLLALTSTTTLTLFDKSVIPQGSTITDIFTARIGGEIIFASKQAPEYYQVLANKLNDNINIDSEVFVNHAKRLAQFRDAYPQLNPSQKKDVAQALFFLAAHQPGVFMSQEHKNYLHNVKNLIPERMQEKSQIEKQLNLLNSSAKPALASANSTADMLQSLAGNTSAKTADKLNNKLGHLEKAVVNLNKAVTEIEKLNVVNQKMKVKPHTEASSNPQLAIRPSHS